MKEKKEKKKLYIKKNAYFCSRYSKYSVYNKPLPYNILKWKLNKIINNKNYYQEKNERNDKQKQHESYVCSSDGWIDERSRWKGFRGKQRISWTHSRFRISFQFRLIDFVSLFQSQEKIKQD